MSTAVTARAVRNADLIAVVSGLLHTGLVAFGFFLADQSGSRTYLFLSAFAALGLVATLLAWASVKAGRGVWAGGLAVLGLSIGNLSGALFQEEGLAMISIAIPMVFIDYLLFANAQRALSRP